MAVRTCTHIVHTAQVRLKWPDSWQYQAHTMHIAHVCDKAWQLATPSTHDMPTAQVRVMSPDSWN